MAEKEYIEREMAEDVFQPEMDTLLQFKRYCQFDKEEKAEYDRLDFYQRAIRSIPAADVAPVRHGRWEKRFCHPMRDGEWQYVCSACKGDDYWNKNVCTQMHNYCPNCGTKMDL